MESYLKENFGGVQAKHSSDEALGRWRKVVGVVKNPKRRFRFTANLDKRSEVTAMKRKNHVSTRCCCCSSPLISSQCVSFACFRTSYPAISMFMSFVSSYMPMIAFFLGIAFGLKKKLQN